MFAHRSFCCGGDESLALYGPFSQCLCDLVTQKSQGLVTAGSCLGQNPDFDGAASPALGEGRKMLVKDNLSLGKLVVYTSYQLVLGYASKQKD